jgi:hypothetical protein
LHTQPRSWSLSLCTCMQGYSLVVRAPGSTLCQPSVSSMLNLCLDSSNTHFTFFSICRFEAAVLLPGVLSDRWLIASIHNRNHCGCSEFCCNAIRHSAGSLSVTSARIPGSDATSDFTSQHTTKTWRVPRVCCLILKRSKRRLELRVSLINISLALHTPSTFDWLNPVLRLLSLIPHL